MPVPGGGDAHGTERKEGLSGVDGWGAKLLCFHASCAAAVVEWHELGPVMGNYTRGSSFKAGSYSRCIGNLNGHRFLAVESDRLSKDQVGAGPVWNGFNGWCWWCSDHGVSLQARRGPAPRARTEGSWPLPAPLSERRGAARGWCTRTTERGPGPAVPTRRRLRLRQSFVVCRSRPTEQRLGRLFHSRARSVGAFLINTPLKQGVNENHEAGHGLRSEISGLGPQPIELIPTLAALAEIVNEAYINNYVHCDRRQSTALHRYRFVAPAPVV